MKNDGTRLKLELNCLVRYPAKHHRIPDHAHYLSLYLESMVRSWVSDKRTAVARYRQQSSLDIYLNLNYK